MDVDTTSPAAHALHKKSTDDQNVFTEPSSTGCLMDRSTSPSPTADSALSCWLNPKGIQYCRGLFAVRRLLFSLEYAYNPLQIHSAGCRLTRRRWCLRSIWRTCGRFLMPSLVVTRVAIMR